MRILIVNKYWLRKGGVEEYCFMLQDVLEQLGHEVVPFSQLEAETLESRWSEYFVPPVDPTESGAVNRIRTARRSVIGDETTAAVRRLLDDVQIDAAHVVHAYHQLGPYFMNELARRAIPTLLSIHDYKLCCPSYRLFDDRTKQICTTCLDAPSKAVIAPATTGCWNGSHSGGVLLAAEALSVRLRKPYHTAKQVLVSNALMHRCAVAAGIPADRIRVVPNFWPATGEPPARTPGGHALFVGRFTVEKGVDVLIRAAASSGVPVRIVGDGPLRDSLETLATELGAPVEFVGQVFGPQVEEEMLAALGLIVPSIWHEVSPLVIYQAMSLGVPVVASEVGGVPDLLGDGRGTLLPHGDVDALAAALERLRDEPTAFLAGATSAAEHSRTELSRERFVERLGDAYRAAGIEL